MNQPEDDSLIPDSQFQEALARVSYQPGMLLGLEATRAEQDYHRRRLNRHQYWLHGSGTVCGLRVHARAEQEPADEDTPAVVRLFVAPGVGLDGLGREVTVTEPYCVDLSAWLTTQHQDENAWETLIRDGYEEAANALWLKVTMRYQECASGYQPVLAASVNAGTDPVKPSRVKDCVALELLPERPVNSSQEHPFPAHAAVPELATIAGKRLGPIEQKRLDGATGAARKRLEMGARMLFALGEDDLAVRDLGELEETAALHARTLLARVRIRLAQDRKLILNPRRIEVDNLAREFLFSPNQIARNLGE
ncbi:MAG: hypothetical protein HZB71_01835 [Betaproteobacteria bacterium]|nr:hypothetical protein [Betaproteobacteria bacterium]